MPPAEVFYGEPTPADLAGQGPLPLVPLRTDGRGNWLGVPEPGPEPTLPLVALPGSDQPPGAIFQQAWPGLALPKGAFVDGETGQPCLTGPGEWRRLGPDWPELAKNTDQWVQWLAADQPLALLLAAPASGFVAQLATGPWLAHALGGKTWGVPRWLPGPGQRTPNLAGQALDWFRQHYRFAEQHEERAWANGERVAALFDFRDFDQCRVVPDFATQLRTLIELGEGKEARQLGQTIHAPTATTAKSFASIAKVFGPIWRRFERSGPSLCLGPESLAVMAAYFAKAGQAYELLADFFASPTYDQPVREIGPDDIFYYCAGVLTSPAYQAEHAYYLAREVPPVPLYADFWDWRDRGQRLAAQPMPTAGVTA
jgi:hypothetical protein